MNKYKIYLYIMKYKNFKILKPRLNIKISKNLTLKYKQSICIYVWYNSSIRSYIKANNRKLVFLKANLLYGVFVRRKQHMWMWILCSHNEIVILNERTIPTSAINYIMVWGILKKKSNTQIAWNNPELVDDILWKYRTKIKCAYQYFTIYKKKIISFCHKQYSKSPRTVYLRPNKSKNIINILFSGRWDVHDEHDEKYNDLH